MNYPEVPTRFVDVRAAETSEQISLDLARHLPRRLNSGPVVIVAERPATFLPVLRKRWMRIVREVERQRASTLNHEKRQALESELCRMRSFRFGTSTSRHRCDALVIGTAEQSSALSDCLTLYLTAQLSPEFPGILTKAVPSCALFVIYQPAGQAIDLLTQHNADRVQLHVGTELLKDPL
jgi:hypothetical protein